MGQIAICGQVAESKRALLRQLSSTSHGRVIPHRDEMGLVVVLSQMTRPVGKETGAAPQADVQLTSKKSIHSAHCSEDAGGQRDGGAHVEACEEPSGSATSCLAPLGDRLGTMAAIILPFLGLVAAAFLLWGWGFSWVDLGLLLGMYVADGLGITVGFHRLFIHRSFETYPVVQVRLRRPRVDGRAGVAARVGGHCTAGTTSTATRRDDPHSPHHHGGGVLGPAARLLARPHRLVLRARPAGPGPLRQGPAHRAASCGWRAPCSRCGWSSAWCSRPSLGGLLIADRGGRLRRA